jgi:hypothetical protein
MKFTRHRNTSSTHAENVEVLEVHKKKADDSFRVCSRVKREVAGRE